MINLDERYLSYLDGSKKMRIDGIEEKGEKGEKGENGENGENGKKEINL